MKIALSNIGFASVFLLTMFGCGPKNNQPNVELIQDMMVQESIKPQEHDEYFKHGISSLVPPANTQPIGNAPYKYASDMNAALRELKNPYAGQYDEATLAVGQKFYETNCMVCHGSTGMGDGPVTAKYPSKIPALTTDKIKGWSDAQIFHTISVGQGLMGPYASHIPQKYRWQVVQYIRQIQKKQ